MPVAGLGYLFFLAFNFQFFYLIFFRFDSLGPRSYCLFSYNLSLIYALHQLQHFV
jgi:hypothetical protein